MSNHPLAEELFRETIRQPPRNHATNGPCGLCLLLNRAEAALDSLTEERDRLAAENARLTAENARLKQRLAGDHDHGDHPDAQ